MSELMNKSLFCGSSYFVFFLSKRKKIILIIFQVAKKAVGNSTVATHPKSHDKKTHQGNHKS